MKNNLFTSALAFLLGMMSVYGQVNLSGMELASTDSLTKSSIRYFSPGRGGRGKVWDFTKRFYKNLCGYSFPKECPRKYHSKV